MTVQAQKDWRELCAAVASENDPKKLLVLIQELTQALDFRSPERLSENGAMSYGHRINQVATKASYWNTK